MIKSMVMPKIPFTSRETIELVKYNFFFGNNGTGKSSIARMIFRESNAKNFHDVVIDTDAEILVYNKDFSKRVFSDKTRVPGVFLLGEDAGRIEGEVNELNEEEKNTKKRISNYESSKAELEDQIKIIENTFVETCWGVAETQRKKFNLALDGKRQRNSFAQYCLDNYTGIRTNTKEDHITSDIDRAFGTTLEAMNTHNIIKQGELDIIEKDQIFKKVIIGDENIEFGELIKALSNSDWVFQGLNYLTSREDVCPFCQQRITNQIVDKIRSVFNAQYEKDKSILGVTINKYVELTEEISDSIYFILQEKAIGYDYSRILSLYDSLKAIIQENLRFIQEKEKEPSKIVVIKSVLELIDQINECIEGINSVIIENNQIVKFKKKEQAKIALKVIGYIANDVLGAAIGSYKEQLEKKRSGINKLDEKIGGEKTILRDTKQRIDELKSSVSSIEKTLLFIQRTMDSIGFSTFRIVATEDGKAFKIIRHDGSCVEDTLSEGEYGFISFLYFYYLIVGRSSDIQSDKKKVVVIDDPISSLDSNGLFYIAGLIDEILQKLSRTDGLVEQLILFTHNAYFLKQLIAISDHNRNEKPSFFLIEKNQTCSTICKVEKKQFESSYESLWRIVINTDSKNSQLVLNAMRRIIDDFIINYVGKKKYDLCNQLTPEHQCLYRTLLMVTNAGSHDVPDDFAFFTCGKDISGYLEVFKEVFSITGFEEHYRLMEERVREKTH